jgi:hypothetical protein
MGLPRSTFYDAPAAHLDDTEIVDPHTDDLR